MTIPGDEMAIVKCKECGGEMSPKADTCPKCGAKLKRPPGCLQVILVVLLGFVALALIALLVGKRDSASSPYTAARAGAPSPAKAPDEAYPGPWRTDGPAFDKIAMTLGGNSIGGCGEFHYRLAKGKSDPGEALVYCTRDGRNWDHYLVFYKINNVMRVKAEPGVPVPKTLISAD